MSDTPKKLRALDLVDRYTMAGPVLREVANIIAALGTTSEYHVDIDTGVASLVAAMSILTDVFVAAADGDLYLAETLANNRADAYDEDLQVILSRKDMG